MKRLVTAASIAALLGLGAAALTHAPIGSIAVAQTVQDRVIAKDVQISPQVKQAVLRPWPLGASEDDAWRIAQQRDTVQVYEQFMREYPQSRFFNQARDRRRVLLATQQPIERDRGITPLPKEIINPPPAPPPPPPPPLPPKVVLPPNPPSIQKGPAPQPAPQQPTETRSFEMKKAEDQKNSGDGPTAAPSPGAPPGPGSNTGSAPGPGGNTGAAPVRTVMTAVMTELLPTDQRRAQNGGAAMVLLTNTPAQAGRNAALCRALYTQLDTATTGEVDVGVRNQNGVVQILRPVYWFMRANRQPTSAGPEACNARLANYHFNRAATVTQRLGLVGQGPWLAVVNSSDTAAGFIDLSRASETEIAMWVKYFKESYSHRNQIWQPAQNPQGAPDAQLTAFLQREFGNRAQAVLRTLTTLPRAVLR